jgi:phosphate starvation-inducible PhoH-like protein
MKMFLTRMGSGTRAVVTGDITQNDLPPGRVSGLVESLGVIGNIDGVGVVRLEDSDVVRHRLVQAIVRAYARSEQARKRSRRSEEFEPAPVFAEPR